ncbi:MAG: ABC transporter ATP-binding protein [Eisenbergiella sp.]
MEKIWGDGMSILGHFIARREGILFGGDSVIALIHFVQNLLIYGYLIVTALNGEMSASQFLLYLGVAGGIGAWMDGILNQFNELHKQNGSLSSIRECIEWKEPFLFEEGKPLKKEQSACEIRLENVSFRYPEAKKDTISGMNLTIRPGEKLAIVGLNGAGKTTLVKLICGFLDPTEGRVLLNGQDIRQYNRRDYYELLSAVFQDFSILECSVAKNVSQNPVDIDREKVKRCLEQAGIWEKIESLPKGMDTPIGKSVYEDGVELSGGQTQRLVLARALYKEPQILVLDEPTAALDPLAENDIYQRYESMTRGKTSLFISHRLASTQFCDRILFLANGKIAEEGTHQELLELGKEYAKLFEVQSRYYREEVRKDGE